MTTLGRYEVILEDLRWLRSLAPSPKVANASAVLPQFQELEIEWLDDALALDQPSC